MLPLIAFQVLVLFNIALPKGGVQVGGLPLTWGYFLLVLFSGVALIGIIRRPGLSVWPFIQTFLLFLPIVAIIFIKYGANELSLGGLLTTTAIFGILPLATLVLCGPFLEDIPTHEIARALRWAIRFAVLWGLMNFLLYAMLKIFVEIPYITINAADAGEIYQKNNRRGSLMKLVSTYNNGNIYGVCMIMLWPIYLKIEPKRIFKLLFILSLICTLSRTVWFGAIVATGMCIFARHIRVLNFSLWIGIFVGFGLIVLLLPLIGWTPDKVVDSSLGGRVAYLGSYGITFWGEPGVTIPEIVYVGFLRSFGIIGLAICLAALFIGPIYGVINWDELSELRRGAVLGTLSYLAAAVIDGAFVFPPTLLLFLFLTALIYRRGLRPQREIRRPPARYSPLAVRSGMRPSGSI